MDRLIQSFLHPTAHKPHYHIVNVSLGVLQPICRCYFHLSTRLPHNYTFQPLKYRHTIIYPTCPTCTRPVRRLHISGMITYFMFRCLSLTHTHMQTNTHTHFDRFETGLQPLTQMYANKQFPPQIYLYCESTAVNYSECVSPQIFIINYNTSKSIPVSLMFPIHTTWFNITDQLHAVKGIEVTKMSLFYNHLKCFRVSLCNDRSLETHRVIP